MACLPRPLTFLRGQYRKLTPRSARETAAMFASPGHHPSATLEIATWATDPERPLLAEAARLLAECLGAATGTAWDIRLSSAEAVRSGFWHYRGADRRGTRKVAVFTLLADLLQPALDVCTAARHWGDICRAVQRAG